MKRNRLFLHAEQKKQGFTLTELALVLGILGMILSGIWAAARSVRSSFAANDLIHEIQVFQQNSRNLLGKMSINSVGASVTDSCGTACSTQILLRSGVFLPDFIPKERLVTASSYGLGGTLGSIKLYVTKYGYLVWTGIENSALYAYQYGCGSSCPSQTSTVVELDLFGLPNDVCTKLLVRLMNGHIDNLVGVSTLNAGWGPITSSYSGNSVMPTSLSVEDAINACTSGEGLYSYTEDDSGNQIWLWFANN